MKVISWKDPGSRDNPIKVNAKITAEEWDIYSKRVIKTNVTYDKQRVMNDLKETQELIQKHGGFAE